MGKRLALGALGYFFLFSGLTTVAGGAEPPAKLSDLAGTVWKIPSEAPGGVIYYFEVKPNGETHLIYPPEQDFLGQAPHAANKFVAVRGNEYVLSRWVQTPQGAVNWFQARVKQTHLAGFDKLAENGLGYTRNAAGELIPNIPPGLRTWLPKLVPSTREEANQAKDKGEKFEAELFKEQQLSFNGEVPCPADLKLLVDFPAGAFEEAKKFVRFTPVKGNDAKVTEGTSKYTLFVQANPLENAIGLWFFDGDKEVYKPLKLYRTTGNHWVVPKADPKSKALTCQQVSMDPVVHDGEPAPVPDVNSGK